MRNQGPDLLGFIVDRIDVGIFVLNRSLEVLLWNRFMASHSGIAAAEICGRNLLEVFPELPRRWLQKKIESVYLLKNFAFTSWEQRPYLFRFRHNRPVTGGVECMMQSCTFLPVKDDAGEVEAVCVTLFDATDTAIVPHSLERVMQSLRDSAKIDGLTGAYNRRHLDERLREEFERYRRHGSPLSVVLLDLDHFKRVNDVHGHLAGDEVLRIVAERISYSIRSCDVFGRYGGEEFEVLLPETPLDGARVVAQKLRCAIAAQPVPYKDALLEITISAGVAQAATTHRSHEDLVRTADAALYRSKAEGRNRVGG